MNSTKKSHISDTTGFRENSSAILQLFFFLDSVYQNYYCENINELTVLYINLKFSITLGTLTF